MAGNWELESVRWYYAVLNRHDQSGERPFPACHDLLRFSGSIDSTSLNPITIFISFEFHWVSSHPKKLQQRRLFCSLAYMNAQLNLPITKYTQYVNQLHRIMCLIKLTTLRGLLTFILFLPYSKSKTSINNNKIKMWNVCLKLQITSILGLLLKRQNNLW